MRELVICGGRPIKGQIRIQGSKNSALPILAAALLTEETCEIKNCPRLRDILAAFEIIRELGAEVTYDGDTAVICAKNINKTRVSEELARRMRSSVLFLGAVLGRCKKACVSYPGGCALGVRPIDMHLRAMTALGIELEEDNGYISADSKNFTANTVTFMFPSVGATENILLLCALSEGETILLNPAREPEIVDLQNFLNCMGADICGAGTDVIRIRGVRKLHGCTYSVIPDRIVASTYACAATACGGDVLMTGAEPGHMRMFLSVLGDMGAEVRTENDCIEVKMEKRPIPVPIIKTLPYPGFPTDMQPPLMAALLKSRGTSVVNETIFENRFKHVAEFMRMGADIRVEDRNAVIKGVDKLHGADVCAADLRGGAALAVAGLSAEGCTRISGIEYVERGYEDIEKALSDLGGDVKIEE